jgi:hypothetical protein
MRLSEGRISYLAHQIVATLKKEGLAEIESERHVLAEIKRTLEHQHDQEAELDAIVRRKIASLSRNVPPGSREWDVLYRRYLDEEHQKRKTRSGS